MSLVAEWEAAKLAEEQARERRRDIEDRILSQSKVDGQQEGSTTLDMDGARVRITTRMNRKIDADKLQEIAIEHGVHQHLGDLFRWKPEINKKAWDAASDEVTRPLMDAITTTPGRPSFSIDRKEK